MYARPLSSLLEQARLEWPRDLVPVAAFEWIREAARLAPPLASGLYAECHLEEETRTDLIVRLHPPDREALLRLGSLPDRLTRTLRRWQDANEPLAFLPAFDLEFDLPGRVEPYFECPLFEPEFMGGVSAIVERDASRDRMGLPSLAEDVGAAVLRALHPDIDGRILTELERCRRAMPAWGAFMPCRPFEGRLGSSERGVRVIASLRRDHVLDYLGRIDWPGRGAELDEVMTQFVGDAVTVSLDLTVRPDGAAPSIGIYWETLWAHPNDAALVQICRRIEAAGWTGRLERWRGLSDWIRGRESDVARSLSLKLVVAPNVRPALKAYISNFDELGAFCEWKNPRKPDPI